MFQENLVLSEREKELRGQKDSTGHIKKSNLKASKKTMQKHQEYELEQPKFNWALGEGRGETVLGEGKGDRG